MCLCVLGSLSRHGGSKNSVDFPVSHPEPKDATGLSFPPRAVSINTRHATFQLVAGFVSTKRYLHRHHIIASVLDGVAEHVVAKDGSSIQFFAKESSSLVVLCRHRRA